MTDPIALHVLNAVLMLNAVHTLNVVHILNVVHMLHTVHMPNAVPIVNAARERVKRRLLRQSQRRAVPRLSFLTRRRRKREDTGEQVR